MTAHPDCHCERSIVRVRAGSYRFTFPKRVDGSVARGVSDPVPSRGGFRLLKLVGLKAARRLFHRARNVCQDAERGLSQVLKPLSVRASVHALNLSEDGKDEVPTAWGFGTHERG